MGATAIVEIDTEADKDSRAIFEKQQEINKVTAIYDWFYPKLYTSYCLRKQLRPRSGSLVGVL